ncbi:energy-coupling factor ABC transporter permease [Rhodococcus sp. G-MC3]|uniref:energy-coupling factor ABC transporter permease n=1 Tax=Rhodococcus sp. G-MC3 TaxID=3046209 RepID=UPI0024BB116B|nr:energy-coupling factor ABC transporter permease [Rhodococcus sp. G-MC3]MDJ0394708.1 energy-coupling factor ABC transporter permease [Rhodococcus sp. G-MC3]
MHMSDGIVNLPTSLLFGVIAIVGVGLCAWKARSELDERTVPMAGLVAAFVFAVQMVNFPILPGVSGHLLGGALAAILVGPFTGALCVSIVLVVQALLFADGGTSALGTNITNMALIGVCVGYGVALLLRPVLLGRSTPTGRALTVGTPGGLGALAFLAALCGTVCAAMGFVLEYALGGSVSGSLGTVGAYMLGTHVLIGIGEGLITALTVLTVARARPDLVYLLRTAPKRHTSDA